MTRVQGAAAAGLCRLGAARIGAARLGPSAFERPANGMGCGTSAKESIMAGESEPLSRNGYRRAASVWLCIAVCVGCAGGSGGSGASQAWRNAAVDDFLGVYQGSFGSALTEDPADDLNYHACDRAVERCLGSDALLADIVLDLDRDAEGRVRLAFFRSLNERERGDELDLLGRGCSTRIGPMSELRRGDQPDRWIAVFPLHAANRLCLNKLRPTSTHELKVELGEDPDTGTRFAQVLIDKEVTSTDYLFVVEHGQKRKVRIDLDNTLEPGAGGRYRVCIEDDLGEYERCVATDRELKRFFMPVPLPGGAAASYTWWHELVPRLERTRGLYHLEQYAGRFDRVAPVP